MAKSTSLADAITANVHTRGPRCGVALLDLTPADRSDLEAAFTVPHIPSSAIAKALQGRGHHISATSVQRHRRGECACGR